MYFGSVEFEGFDLEQMIRQRRKDTERLEEILSRVPEALEQLEEDDACEPRGPNWWSRKQVLGHLVDSAWNNHERIVRAAVDGRGDFPGYDQEQWVEVQHYQDIPWLDLVPLWVAVNRHLARLVCNLPADRLEARCSVGGSEPVSLLFIIHDYVTHLEHHLRQILD